MRTSIKLFIGLVFSATALFNLSTIVNAQAINETRAPNPCWNTGVACPFGGTYSVCQMSANTTTACSPYGATDPSPKCPTTN